MAQQLLAAGRIDEIDLDMVPCLLGAGVRMLDNVGPVDMVCERVIPCDGVTHIRYACSTDSGAPHRGFY